MKNTQSCHKTALCILLKSGFGEEVQTKIRDLKRIEQILFNLKESCPDKKSMYDCPITETLMIEEK